MKQYLVFSLQHQLYAVNIQWIQEVAKKKRMVKWPGMEQEIEGIMVLREEIIPIVDAKKKWCKKQTEESSEYLIVMANQKQVIGWLVDEVIEIITIEEQEEKMIMWPAHLRENAWIKHVILRREQMIGILSQQAFQWDKEEKL